MDRKHKKTAWVTAGMMLMASLPAFAAGLGKLTVTSTLGQPFRGEIELLAVDKKDLGSLRATFASREAFKDASIERSPALSGMRFSVEQKKNGDPYLKITSSKPIEEPFLDMLIELDWPSGRLVREYTVLLDPPGYGEPQAAAPVTAPTAKAAPAAKADEMKPAEVPAAVQPEIRANIPLDQKLLGKGEKKAAAPSPAGGEEYGPVKKGQNLAGIAAEVKPEGVSLEQMLVALFQTNKQAFAGNNMNRLKAGQILRLPEADKIGEVEQKTAAKEVRAQAADWHAYRQKLAAAVAEAKPAQEETKQAASGKITTAVEDKAAAAKEPAKDVLKLSKSEALGGAKAGTAAPGAAGAGGGKEMQAMKDQLHAMQEESTAKEKAIKEANQRIGDLEKNIKEMQKLLELKNQNLADLQKQAASAKAAAAAPAPAPTPAPVAAAPVKPEEKPAAAPAETKAEAAKPAAPAAGEKPATQPKKPKVVVAEPKMAESSLLDDLLENPLYLGGGVLAALLIGLLGAKGLAARRKKSIASFEDSIMTNGDLKANTVLGGTSGGKIDTSDTSFLTDFSQAGLGAIDTNEVDPIAEAEVYMAYGRDAQAEEILKEAMVKDPARQEIRLKLLEIYAGRKNLNAFEAVAGEMYATLGGKGSPVWDKAAELGRSLDPQNPLYGEQAKGAPAAAPATAPEEMFEKTMIVAGGAAGVVAAAEHGVTLDLGAPQEVESAAPDLDFNLDLGTPTVAGKPEAAPAEEAAPVAEEAATDLGFDFDLSALTGAPAEAPATAAPAAEEKAEEGAEDVLDFNLDLGSIGAPAAPAAEAKTEQEGAHEEGVMEFDLGAFTQPAPAAPEAAAATEELISAESWQDEVMGLDIEAAPIEAAAAPAPELEMSDFAAAAPAAAESESIELAAPPVEEAPLDFDFDLGQEEMVSAAPAPAAESAVPDLDLTGISLDIGAAAPAEPAAGPVDFGSQEVSTKLDLARAYVDMGDMEGAREILQEVIREGGAEQQEEAKKLLSELG